MKYINIGLTVVVLALCYFLYRTIAEPIEFEAEKQKRYDAIKERLEDIKTAQIAYKESKGGFANSFEALTDFIKNDSIMLIKVIGNPDDTTITVIRDTTYQSVLANKFDADFNPDSIAFVPYTGGATFDIEAGKTKSNNVVVMVFEVSTNTDVIFENIEDKRFIEPGRYTLGSMMEASFAIKAPL